MTTTISSSTEVSSNLTRGAIAGLAGGAVFGVMMSMMGMIGMIGGLLGEGMMGNIPVSWIVHLIISAIIGAGFGFVASYVGPSLGTLIGAGLGYGLLWWILGPLIIMPSMMGMGLQLSGEGIANALPSLWGHLIYGGITGFTYHWLTNR